MVQGTVDTLVTVAQTKTNRNPTVIWEELHHLPSRHNGYNVMPHIYLETAPSPSMTATPIQYTHSSTDLTHHPKWLPHPINRFAIVHTLDRQTDRPTHGIGDNSVRITAYALLVSDAANNYCTQLTKTVTKTELINIICYNNAVVFTIVNSVKTYA